MNNQYLIAGIIQGDFKVDHPENVVSEHCRTIKFT